jgi:acyl-CoA synthetase (AMP-forming)/AMP-acid ligase II
MIITPKASTLAALLRGQADERGDSTAYRYLAHGEIETGSITFGELEVAALAVAARLQETTMYGDRALILAENAIEFIGAFMGCQLAGAIAVPVGPPFPS